MPAALPKIKLGQFPLRAWKALAAGTFINLAPGILYAWSVWAKALIDEKKAVAGVMQEGLNTGWPYLTNSQAATPYSLCIILATVCMIPGGRIHDKWGPSAGVLIGGCFLALGFMVAGLSKTFIGLVLGFGLLGGIGMGLVSASSVPPAIRWFGPRLRGFAAGVVVGGSGAAVLYIFPFASYLIQSGGLSHSFFWMGAFMVLLISLGGSQIACPPADYTPPGSTMASQGTPLRDKSLVVECTPGKMLRTRQYYLLVFMFSCVLQIVLLLLAHGGTALAKVAKGSPFLMANAWIWVTFGALAKTASPIATGIYSDKTGRVNAFSINGLLVWLCLPLVPGLFEVNQVFPFMAGFFIANWVYGGCLALMPAFAADLFGEKHLGMNYGLIVQGCLLGFLMTRLSTIIKDITNALAWAGYLSALAIIAAIMSYLLKRSITPPS
jgi:OFA family oxalate/formate antiporter-like MFS transporter